MIRRKYQFFGRVQGVGFRYKAYHLAFARSLTGWVQNEWDGSVKMEVQGAKEKIDQMVQALQADRFILISNYTEKEIPLIEDERRFRVSGY